MTKIFKGGFVSPVKKIYDKIKNYGKDFAQQKICVNGGVWLRKD